MQQPSPPPQTVAWVERTLGGGAHVLDARRLTGGLTSQVHRLTVEQAGRRTQCVLRWWRDGGGPANHAASAVASETAILGALAASDLPVPRVLGSTSDPTAGPAVLMTLVPGRVHLMARDRERWLQQIARMLVRIHALAIAAPAFESWLDPAQLAPPPDASRPDLWRAAIALVAHPPPPTRERFVHRDYQHFNLLWTRERLTGVVDWINASMGPPDIDVGHCRLNLAVLFSPDVAERFRLAYGAEAGRAVDPWWDVHALLSFDASWQRFLPIQIDGRAPLDVAGMTRRVEDVLALTLRRL